MRPAPKAWPLIWAMVGIVLLYAIFADQPTLVWVFGGLCLAAYYFLKAEINQIELYLNRQKDASEHGAP